MTKLNFRIDCAYRGGTGILLPVALRCNGRETDLMARLDTGASFCILQRLHAETVGIDVTSGVPTRISTVTGSFMTYGHDVSLGVLGIAFDTMVYFAEDPMMPRDVLGLTGWLDRVRMALIDYDRRLYLSSYDDVGT